MTEEVLLEKQSAGSGPLLAVSQSQGLRWGFGNTRARCQIKRVVLEGESVFSGRHLEQAGRVFSCLTRKMFARAGARVHPGEHRFPL